MNWSLQLRKIMGILPSLKKKDASSDSFNCSTKTEFETEKPFNYQISTILNVVISP